MRQNLLTCTALALLLGLCLCGCEAVPEPVSGAAETPIAQTNTPVESPAPTVSPTPSPAPSPTPTQKEDESGAELIATPEAGLETPYPVQTPKSIWDDLNNLPDSHASEPIGLPRTTSVPRPTATPNTLKRGNASGDLYWVFGDEPSLVSVSGGDFQILCVQKDDQIQVSVTDPIDRTMTYCYSEPFKALQSCAVTRVSTGQALLLVSFEQEESGFQTLFLLEDGEKLTNTAQLDGRVLFYEDGVLTVEGQMELMGKRIFRRTYTISADGKPTDGTPCDLSMNPPVTVQKGKALPATNASGLACTIPGGTELTLLNSDGKTYLTCQSPQGDLFTVHLTSKGEDLLIEKEDASNWFD